MRDIHDLMVVRFNDATGQRHLYATEAFRAGEVIAPFGAREVMATPSYLTVQTDMDTHILLAPEILQYCNHSCAPNVFFDTSAMTFLALRDVAAGEELTFFYPSTEWTMAQPFACHCGTEACLGVIRGAAHIPEEILAKYTLTDFIKRELKASLAAATNAVAT